MFLPQTFSKNFTNQKEMNHGYTPKNRALLSTLCGEVIEEKKVFLTNFRSLFMGELVNVAPSISFLFKLQAFFSEI